MPVTLRIHAADDPEMPPRAVVVRSFPATIGRGHRSRVRLDDESVSTDHAVISLEGTSYVVRDAGSLNGTVVGGLRVARDAARQLSDGDVLRVGRFWLQVHLEATALAGEMNTRDLALGLVSKVLHHLPNDHALRVVEGPRRGELVLLTDGEETALGRDARSAVRLEGAQVSRDHVRVTRRGSSVFVRDGGSRNGSSLGGEPLPQGQEVEWPPVAHLQTGSVVLALCGPRPPLDTLLGLPDESTPPPSQPAPNETPSLVEVPSVVDSGATLGDPEGESPVALAAPMRAVSMSDQTFDPAVERRAANVSMLLPALALLVLLACIVGIGWLIMT